MKIDFSFYSPQELRDQTEIEFQRCGDAKQAVYNAIAILNQRYGIMEKATQLSIGTKIEAEHKDTINFIKDYIKKHGKLPPEKEVYSQIAKDHLAEFRDYYTRLQTMEKEAEEEMSKAKNLIFIKMEKAGVFKYIQKIPVSGGKFRYIYKDDFKNPIKALMDIFSFSKEKIQDSYNQNNIKEKYNVDVKEYSRHVLEYMANKQKWETYFNTPKVKKESTESKEKKPTEKKEKSVKVMNPKTKMIFNKSIMQDIHNSFNAPKKEEKKQSEIMNKIQNANYWNGSIYGNEKNGYRIYLDNKEIKISNSEKEEIESALKRAQEKKQEKQKQDIVQKKNSIIEDRIKETLIPYLKKDMKDVDTKQMEDALKEEVQKWGDNLKKEEEKEQHNIDYWKNNIFQYLKEKDIKIEGVEKPEDIKSKMLEDIRKKTAGRFDSHSIHSQITDLGRVLTRRNDKKYREKQGTQYIDWDNITSDDYYNFAKELNTEHVEKIKTLLQKEKEKIQRRQNAKERIIGNAKWNEKVYGKQGNYSIYLSGEKKDISDEDAEELKALY